MNMELKKLTKELCALSGPTGFEKPVYNFLADYLKPVADEISTDPMGNFLAVKRCGEPGTRMMLLDAHMDEIGFIVTDIKKGFLCFESLGGVDQRMLPAREVKVLTDPPIFGVIDTMPPHIIPAEEMGRAIEPKKLCIDVGFSQEEAEKCVPIGTPAVYAAGCSDLGRDMLCGKALDDRACVAIIVKAFENLASGKLRVDLCCQISTQEEVGHRGARVGAWTMKPDEAIAVDVTHGCTPDAKDFPIHCRKGPAIGVGPNMTPSITKKLLALSSERGIPFQTEVTPQGNSGTDAEAIQVVRGGVTTALISLPLKYMHTPVEVVSCEDMDAICRLIEAYVEEMEV